MLAPRPILFPSKAKSFSEEAVDTLSILPTTSFRKHQPARVLGLVASGAGIVSLAVQLGSIVCRLKKVCGKITNAGEDIRYLIEEVKTTSLVLREIGDCNYLEGDSLLPVAATQRCLELCRRSTETLSGIAVDLDERISKQRLKGRLMATLKEETINQLRERLRFAQALLMVSCQIYSE
jgi:hypothetical protein